MGRILLSASTIPFLSQAFHRKLQQKGRPETLQFRDRPNQSRRPLVVRVSCPLGVGAKSRTPPPSASGAQQQGRAPCREPTRAARRSHRRGQDALGRKAAPSEARSGSFAAFSSRRRPRWRSPSAPRPPWSPPPHPNARPMQRRPFSGRGALRRARGRRPSRPLASSGGRSGRRSCAECESCRRKPARCSSAGTAPAAPLPPCPRAAASAPATKQILVGWTAVQVVMSLGHHNGFRKPYKKGKIETLPHAFPDEFDRFTELRYKR
mmetsp:Transcript_17779/g.42650  ORF Transcript_17779/g.42650 Transcript_17779/m.42650 type:complete len:265 (-) Transcript_17779:45-839(-)